MSKFEKFFKDLHQKNNTFYFGLKQQHQHKPKFLYKKDNEKRKRTIIGFNMKKYIKNLKKFLKRLKNKKTYQRASTVILVLLGAFFITVLSVFIYFSKDLPDPNRINARDVVESTKIYDRTGQNLLYEIHGEIRRTMVSLDQVSDYVKLGTVAAEDKDFYKHHGFDIKGIIRALFTDVRTENIQGGSTITQQFVKNSILSPEKTLTRKIKELILAVEIELKFSKEEILQMYLNEIPYGSNAYGIEAAAETFFGKKAKDLTLAESAILVSLPKAPTYYSPYGNHFKELKKRQEWVLDRMYEEKMISKEERDKAKKEKLNFVEHKEHIIAPHFVMYVKDYLAEKYGDRFVEEGGLKVYTTLDMDLQTIAEEVVREGVENNKGYNARNAGLVAIDPKTGQILAMQGSRDYFDKENDGNVNVTIRDRQPGSSFKPFAYAAAFKKGYTPDTIVFDLMTDFGNGYKPNNYNLHQYGPVTMRKALAGSLNIASVKTLYLAGIDNTIDLAHKMGITTLNDRSRYGLSLVLGGGEVKLLDMVSAFGVFANDGIRQNKTAILKIIDKNGKVIENNENPKGKEVLKPQIARLINNILSDNQARSFTFGSKTPLTLGDRPVAAKTGTTQEFRDAWTIGYTPNLVAGVWVGNNDNSKMKQGAAGVVVAAPIWYNFMERALSKKGFEKEDFIKPEPIKTKKPILNGQLATETKVILCKPSEKLATEDCPDHLKEERIYRKVHTILYYVDKDNPQGPYPANPAKDPQFRSWEGAVKGWAERNGYHDEDPPKDYDTLHTKENQPTVKIIKPKDEADITSSPISILAKSEAPLGIKKVEFYIDQKLIGSDNKEPYQINYDVSKITNGFHRLIVKAYDVVDNIGETNISINLNIEKPPSVTLISPSVSSKMTKSQFPYFLSAEVRADSGVASLKFYIVNLRNNKTDQISGVIDKENTSKFTASWAYPGQGDYYVYSTVTDNKNRKAFSKQVKITVE